MPFAIEGSRPTENATVPIIRGGEEIVDQARTFVVWAIWELRIIALAADEAGNAASFHMFWTKNDYSLCIWPDLDFTDSAVIFCFTACYGVSGCLAIVMFIVLLHCLLVFLQFVHRFIYDNEWMYFRILFDNELAMPEWRKRWSALVLVFKAAHLLLLRIQWRGNSFFHSLVRMKSTLKLMLVILMALMLLTYLRFEKVL